MTPRLVDSCNDHAEVSRHQAVVGQFESPSALPPRRRMI